MTFYSSLPMGDIMVFERLTSGLFNFLLLDPKLYSNSPLTLWETYKTAILVTLKRFKYWWIIINKCEKSLTHIQAFFFKNSSTLIIIYASSAIAKPVQFFCELLILTDWKQFHSVKILPFCVNICLGLLAQNICCLQQSSLFYCLNLVLRTSTSFS